MWVLWTLHGITSLNRLLHSAIRTMRRDKTPPVPCGQRKVGFEDVFDFVVRKSLQGRLMRKSKEAFSACLARIYTGQGAVFPYVRGAPVFFIPSNPFPEPVSGAFSALRGKWVLWTFSVKTVKRTVAQCVSQGRFDLFYPLCRSRKVGFVDLCHCFVPNMLRCNLIRRKQGVVFTPSRGVGTIV